MLLSGYVAMENLRRHYIFCSRVLEPYTGEAFERERVEIFKRIKISLEHLDITICTKCSMSDLHSTH